MAETRRIRNGILGGAGAMCVTAFAVSTGLSAMKASLPAVLSGEVLPAVIGTLVGVLVAYHEVRRTGARHG